MTPLEVQHLCYDYGGEPVLRNISFTVKPGTFSGLLGPNASGKTTLFKCMNGLLRPRGGRVLLQGRSVAGLPRKVLAGKMAVVPQQSGAAFSFTALDIVVMARASGLSMWQRPSAKDYEGARMALADLGVKALADRMFDALSGGEKQIVLLARALFQSPSVLLLDEPTAHLDFKNQHLVLELVREITLKRGLTTVVTLHDPNLAARYCDAVLMLKDGEILDNGPVREVLREDTLESVYGIKVMVADLGQGQSLVVPRTEASGV